jgi:hypothetical protein
MRTTANFLPTNLVVVGIAMGVSLIAVILGVGLGAGLFVYAIALLGGLYWLAYCFLKLFSIERPRTDLWFWTVIGLIVATSLLAKVTGIDLGAALELGLLAALPIVLRGGWHWLKVSHGARWWLTLFTAFMLISIFSSVLGRSHKLAAIFQFFTNLKFLYIIVLGFSIAWTLKTQRAFWWLVRWSWLPMTLLVAWQWASPGSYLVVFPASSLHSHDISLFPSLAIGPFPHPAILANYTAILFIAQYVAARLSWQSSGAVSLVALSSYLLLLIATGERQELLGVMVVMLVWEVVKLRGIHKAIALISNFVVGMVFAVAFFMLFQQSLTKEIDTWGLSGQLPNAQQEHPRGALYRHSFSVASRYFPLGSGLGTYGSAGAEKFDKSLYADLGFNSYPWYEKQDYLMDTYWPAFIAETGWIGTALLLACYIFLTISTAKMARGSADNETAIYSAIAYCYMGYFLLLSATSPAFQDPTLFLIPGAIVGVATRRFLEGKLP